MITCDMRKTAIVLLGVAFVTISVFAQENAIPSRSMTIEGVYNADVTDAQKLMPVPAKPRTLISQKPVEYISDGFSLKDCMRDPMTAPDLPAVTAIPYSGIVRFGYGMQGNIDFLAHGKLKVGECGTLSVDGTLTGWNTILVHDWNSRMYDTKWNVGYVHRMDDMTIDVNAAFGYEYANFMPAPDDWQIHAPRDNGRNILTGNIEAGFMSVSPDDIIYGVRAGWYICSDDNITFYPHRGTENIFRVNGTAGYEFSGDMSLYVDFALRSNVYREWVTRLRSTNVYENYTSLSLRPHAEWKNTEWYVYAGADLTLRTGFAPRMQAAPNIKARYKVLPGLSLIADITGGLEEYDMRHLYAISPYWTDREQLRDGYTRVNAAVGATWNALSVLEVSLKGGYRNMSNMVFQSISKVDVIGSVLTQTDASALYGELSGKLLLSGRFNATCTAGYYKWNCDGDDELLQMIPQIDVNVALEGRITDRFFGSCNYRYAYMTESCGTHWPPVNQLDVSLGYNVTDKLDVFLKGTNLFRSRYYRFAGYKMQDTAVLASLLFRF